ncbi:hypothetical protein [Aquincola tertiaricarbonis]|uniref:hypothetical protein n=1 Tax=Aquincola tertiaricarbonis TaxID=391953 RepID=UPI0006152C8F|nr:hypothetical protein [Aquincola tertiaricarbonis]
MPSAICFIEKANNIRQIDREAHRYESGNWVVAEEKAASLVGRRIYFLETQAGESFYGGTIESFRVLPDNHPTAPKRVVFTFIADQAGRGFRPGPDGWSTEQKTLP